MPIRKRGDRKNNPEQARSQLPKLAEIPAVPPSKSLVEMQNFKGFQYMKAPAVDGDLLLERRRKKRYIEMARSLPFVSPAIGQILHGAAAFYHLHEIWQRRAFELDPTTSEGMRAANEAGKFFEAYKRAWVTALDTSVRFAKGMSGLKPIEDGKPPPWILTEGKEAEEDSEEDSEEKGEPEDEEDENGG